MQDLYHATDSASARVRSFPSGCLEEEERRFPAEKQNSCMFMHTAPQSRLANPYPDKQLGRRGFNCVAWVKWVFRGESLDPDVPCVGGFVIRGFG